MNTQEQPPSLSEALLAVKQMMQEAQKIESHLKARDAHIKKGIAMRPSGQPVSNTFIYNYKRGERALWTLRRYVRKRHKTREKLNRSDMLFATLVKMAEGRGISVDGYFHYWGTEPMLAAVTIIDKEDIWKDSWRLRVIHSRLKPWINYLCDRTLQFALQWTIAKLEEYEFWQLMKSNPDAVDVDSIPDATEKAALILKHLEEQEPFELRQ